VKQVNPRVIYADVSGYGDKGPDADLPGFDITAYWARTGLLSLTRDAGAPPTLPVAGSGDHATAVSVYSAIVTALYRRERTGQGCWLDLSMAEALMALNSVRTAAVDFRDVSTIKPGGLPFGIFDAADGGHVVIGVNTDRFWALLCDAMGTPELAADPRFVTEQARHDNKAEVMGIVRTWALNHTVDYIIDLLIAHGVPCSPVNGPEEVRESEIFLARNALWEVDSGHGGTVTLPGNPMGFFKGRQKSLRVPRLGEHTQAVLTELGFTEEEVAEVIDGQRPAVRS